MRPVGLLSELSVNKEENLKFKIDKISSTIALLNNSRDTGIEQEISKIV